MITQQLLHYIKQQIDQGVTRSQIRSTLLAGGWSEADLSEAFTVLGAVVSEPPKEDVDTQLLDYIKQQLQHGIGREEIKNALLASNWQEADLNKAFGVIDSANQPSAPVIAPELAAQPASIASTAPQVSSMSAEQISSSVSPQRVSPFKNKAVLAAIFSVAGLLLVGGGVFGYFHFFAGEKSPEEVIATMMAREAMVTSFEFESDMRGESTMPAMPGMELGEGGNMGQAPESSRWNSQVKGKIDFSDLNQFKAELNLNSETDLFEVALEARFFGPRDLAAYIKVNDIGGMFALFLGGADGLTRQWIEINPENILGAIEQGGVGGEEEARTLQEQIAEAEKNLTLSAEQVKRIREVVTQARILKVLEVLPSEKIEGVDTHRYRVALDARGFSQLIADLNVALGDLLPRELIDELKRSVEEMDAQEGTEMKIWIGKRDFLIRKVSFSGRMMGPTGTPFEGQDMGSVTSTTIFRNHNQPMGITVPSPARGIDEVIREFIQGMGAGMEINEGGMRLEM